METWWNTTGEIQLLVHDLTVRYKIKGKETDNTEQKKTEKESKECQQADKWIWKDASANWSYRAVKQNLCP